MRQLCLILFSVIFSVSSNPLGQLTPSCNVCQPTSYTNPTVLIQPSNTNPCTQSNTGRIPTAFTAPLGDTLNQIILSRVLGNPSLQKIIDPNTRLFNQNGDEVNRQVSNAGTPNVINNYFIVPPEFFNLTESAVKKAKEVKVDVDARKPRKKTKRKENIDNDISTTTKTKATSVSGRQQKGTSSLSRKSKRVDHDKSTAIIDELDKSEELYSRKERERDKRWPNIDKEEETVILPSLEDSSEYTENQNPVVNKGRKNKVRNMKQKPEPAVEDEESAEIVTEVPSSSVVKNRPRKISKVKNTKKQQPVESKEQVNDDKILKNIELPTDAPSHTLPEKRKARGSNRKVATKKLEEKNTSSSRKAPSQRIPPFPDNVVNQFFPYMGNYYNPGDNYPHNLDQYYQYFSSNGYPNVNRNKKIRKNQNKKKQKSSAKTHNVEINLKPKQQENITDTTITPNTTQISEDQEEVTVSSEVKTTTESFEQVTEIPMEIPTKRTPLNEDNAEAKSDESYETFSKLDDLHEFITPALGKEDEVPIMNNNGITKDYYPVFHDDVYYSPYIENQNLEDDDDSYLYESAIKDEVKRQRRKHDRYDDSKHLKGLENPGFTTKQVRNVDAKIENYEHKDYLKHTSYFSDTGHEENNSDEGVKPEIRRVKVPRKNTRVPVDNIETIFSGSKVAKYGIPVGKEAEPDNVNSKEKINSTDNPVYIVAESWGRIEDYM